jgi:hypothetical protein
VGDRSAGAREAHAFGPAKDLSVQGQHLCSALNDQAGGEARVRIGDRVWV